MKQGTNPNSPKAGKGVDHAIPVATLNVGRIAGGQKCVDARRSTSGLNLVPPYALCGPTPANLEGTKGPTMPFL